MNKDFKGLISGMLVALGGFALALAIQFPPLIRTARAAADDNHSGPKLKVEQAPINRDQKAGASFAPVVKKVVPSVVNIYSTMTVREQPNPLMDDPFFRRFFGDDSGEGLQPRERKARGLGSGVIVSADGYILT